MVRSLASVVLSALLSTPTMRRLRMPFLPAKPRMFTRAPIADFLTWIRAHFGEIGTFCSRQPWSTSLQRHTE
jgi:hypothetical protein